MTFYQDQKRWKNWIYIQAFIMPKIWEEPLFFPKSNYDVWVEKYGTTVF